MPKPPKRKKFGIAVRRKKGRVVTRHAEHPYSCVTLPPEQLPHPSVGSSFWEIPNFNDVGSGYVHEEKMDLDGHHADEFYVILDSGPVLVSPDTDTDVLYKDSAYEKLRECVKNLEPPEGYFYYSKYSCIQYVSLIESINPSVNVSVTIHRDFSAHVNVHTKMLPGSSDFWTGLPKLYKSVSDVSRLLNRLSMFEVCRGNDREDFQFLVPVGCGISGSEAPSIQAYREMYNCQSTIRHVACELLVWQGQRCCRCRLYSSTLRQSLSRCTTGSRNAPSESLISSRKRESYMTPKELKQKLAESKKIRTQLHHEVESLRKQIDALIQVQGLVLPETDSFQLFSMVSDHQGEVESAFPESDSFQRLFWEQQVKYNKTNKGKGMRWHPMIVRWCLYLRSKSSKAYEAMRSSGFISLPCARTLYDYSHFTVSGCGILPDVLGLLKSACRKQGCYDVPHKRFVGILQDEVKVQDDLVYDKHSGELIGYVDLDSVGNQLQELRDTLKNQAATVARYVLVVMVRGATSGLKFPLANYATDGISSYFLYPIIWKAIEVLEVDLDLRVIFITCDGASPNRKFFHLHRVRADHHLDRVIYRCLNPVSPDHYFLYFISDPPHLLKTSRNCFSNSGGHIRSRNLWNGQEITWRHIVRLFEEHCENNLYTLCPKLTRTHVYLTPFSRMKVNLAAQILSATVAKALEFYYGAEVSKTVQFISIMNKLFDCLNTKNLDEGVRSRNPQVDAYRSVNDDRLRWLLNDCLGYFRQWRETVNNVPGLSKAEKAKMLLSNQTLEGIELSVRSICELTVFLLNSGAPFVLTSAFNQDPLEQHFGHYRHKGGANDNPTVRQVQQIMTELRTVGELALNRRGNVQVGPDSCPAVDDTPLPRRH